jgi:hypothetical protein
VNTTETVALISGLAGVGGAAVGAGATLLVARRSERAQLRRDHDDAILSFWTATATWGSLWSIAANVIPADSNFVQRTFQGIRLSGGYGEQLVERQLSVMEDFWRAMGRVRMAAVAHELRIVSAVETAVGEWNIGEPMPDSFRQALTGLRELVESLGPEAAAVAAEPVPEQIVASARRRRLSLQHRTQR